MIIQPERHTQNRVIQLFEKELGYEYLGNWTDRKGNSNIETEWLIPFLERQGYSHALINRAIDALRNKAHNPNESLFTNNKETYSLLRYGAQVRSDVGTNTESVHFIDWRNIENNHFAIAEEVTILGKHEKRPDIVIYINGIAVGIIELKRGSVDVADAIRQNLTNQQAAFIQPFFGTIQFVFAGNDTQGLKYGTIGTPEKYYLDWKEDEQDNSRSILDKYLLKMCNKARFLELMHDFILFDGGQKKLPRPHQYFGIKAAQERIRKREGGIIWHTQGSGKSITMVLLAKWILESNPKARVAIITDRTELDAQIHGVFANVGIGMHRAVSGSDLMHQLGQASPNLLCSLIHKFGRQGDESLDEFIKGVKNSTSKVVGEVFVFVDECHRTQSDKLHKAMKAMLPNSIFIGFTGTPLLKDDQKTSVEVFGKYIHTYKFNEAINDNIVLDLMYEARDIEQRISSQKKIDAWFESRTKGLNQFQQNALKQRWGTMSEVLSSRNRMQQIVNDIIFDFGQSPRLFEHRGNAILVAGSIYEACKYYELFQTTPLKNKCAVITSYNPSHRDIVNEDIGENTETAKEYIYKIYNQILENTSPASNKTKAETYEEKMKSLFKEQPANMKLLIVVDKLLTGFDAPSCTYIYIDKRMQDHGLFQAICRVNRLDTPDKQFGYIVDYKGLFGKVHDAVSVYTSELAADGTAQNENNILLGSRLSKARARLDGALEELSLLCDPVPAPKTEHNYIQYFCGNTEIASDLKATEIKRMALYRHTVALIRAYSHIAGELEEAGYTESEIKYIQATLNDYMKLRESIRKASGETLDMKAYEADMRFLIDNYIEASTSERIDPFQDQSLLDIILNQGIHKAIASLPESIKSSKAAVADTITNNVRQKIIKEYLIDPAYFEEMSILLANILDALRNDKIDYQTYLQKMAELALKVSLTNSGEALPPSIATAAQRALFHNLNKDEHLALQVDAAVKQSKQVDFRGDERKERLIKGAIFAVLKDTKEVERIFAIITEQKEY